jgi:Xaa-Pro aminopeptidase
MSKLLNRKISPREMNDLYPHHVGHYIGLDVHDTPMIPRSVPFTEGMCITVEPGIYIPNDEIYGEFRGIGVRIEDDIYISKHGPIILSAEAPKEIEDIEHVMRK